MTVSHLSRLCVQQPDLELSRFTVSQLPQKMFQFILHVYDRASTLDRVKLMICPETSKI